jgi:hypothetical protein
MRKFLYLIALEEKFIKNASLLPYMLSVKMHLGHIFGMIKTKISEQPGLKRSFKNDYKVRLLRA